MLGRGVDRRLRHTKRAPGSIWGRTLPWLKRLNGFFFNLECCLTSSTTAWERTPRDVYFRAHPSWAVKALHRGNATWVNLANNHVMDFGEEGLFDTLRNLDRVGVTRSGAGRNRAAAFRHQTVQVGSLRCCFVSLTDHPVEYSAGETRPGVAWAVMDPRNHRTRRLLQTTIQRARRAGPDLLVVSTHAGPNMVERPAPSLRRFRRWLIDQGVDLVHGHSAHVVQGIEVYRDGLILHDTGDFVDDFRANPRLRNDLSFLFECRFDPAGGTLRELRLRPVRIRPTSVNPAGSRDRSALFERMVDRCAPFGTSFRRENDELVLSLEGV